MSIKIKFIAGIALGIMAHVATAQVGYNQVGNETYYNNGVTGSQIGNQTYYSNGRTCSQIGNSVACN